MTASSTPTSSYTRFSSAEGDAAKRTKALDVVVQHCNFGLSAQVLQEFYVTVTRKTRKPLPPDLAVALMDEYRLFPMVPTDYPLIVSAAELSLRYGISYWDGAIIAAGKCSRQPRCIPRT